MGCCIAMQAGFSFWGQMPIMKFKPWVLFLEPGPVFQLLVSYIPYFPKGHAMKRAPIRFIVMAAMLLMLASCASGPQIIPLKLSEGEARLTDIQMPEYVREDLPYNVILTIDSEETPRIRRVCFRWLTEEISSYSPSLYCYSMGGTFGLGGPCAPWTSSPGPVSAPFCSEASEINMDIPGRLTVKIRATDLKSCYNMLEGQVEYLSKDGTVHLTNAVRTPVTVEK
jgi:hypothetical protein